MLNSSILHVTLDLLRQYSSPHATLFSTVTASSSRYLLFLLFFMTDSPGSARALVIRWIVNNDKTNAGAATRCTMYIEVEDKWQIFRKNYTLFVAWWRKDKYRIYRLFKPVRGSGCEAFEEKLKTIEHVLNALASNKWNLCVASAQKYIENRAWPPSCVIDGPKRTEVAAHSERVCVTKSYIPFTYVPMSSWLVVVPVWLEKGSASSRSNLNSFWIAGAKRKCFEKIVYCERSENETAMTRKNWWSKQFRFSLTCLALAYIFFFANSPIRPSDDRRQFFSLTYVFHRYSRYIFFCRHHSSNETTKKNGRSGDAKVRNRIKRTLFTPLSTGIVCMTQEVFVFTQNFSRIMLYRSAASQWFKHHSALIPKASTQQPSGPMLHLKVMFTYERQIFVQRFDWKKNNRKLRIIKTGCCRTIDISIRDQIKKKYSTRTQYRNTSSVTSMKRQKRANSAVRTKSIVCVAHKRNKINK